MKLQQLFERKHIHYLVGYVEYDKFWCVQECSSLETAKDLLDQQLKIFPKKDGYLIVKKTISYEQVQND